MIIKLVILLSSFFWHCAHASLDSIDLSMISTEIRELAEKIIIKKKSADANTRGSCITSFQITQQNIPLTINAPGNYCLVEDVVINFGFNFAINVNTDNVFIDLNDRTINGQRLNNNGIIINGKLNTTIENGSIINCGLDGIVLRQGCQYPVIQNLTIFRCGNGIRGFGVNSGFFTNLFIPLSVTNSMFINNSVLSTSQNCIIQNCFAVQSDGPGFVLLNCLHCIYQSCIAFGNTGVGFTQQNSSQIVYQDCISNDNANDGFSLQGTGITLQNCLANDNSLQGFRIFGGFARMSACQAQSNLNGFDIVTARGLTILESTAHSNVESGFILRAAARECELRNNTAIINPQFGFNNLGVDNTFYTNFAKNNGTNFAGILFFVSPVPADPINFTTNISN